MQKMCLMFPGNCQLQYNKQKNDAHFLSIDLKEFLRNKHDAIVVGSGPNGISAAITLQLEGLCILLVEAKDTIGGGMRSKALTLPGYIHDICSAIYPLAATSNVFQKRFSLNSELEFIYPTFSVGHPFADGTAVVLQKSVKKTAQQFGEDTATYEQLFSEMLRNWTFISLAFLGPPHIPKNIGAATRFSYHAVSSAILFAEKTSEQDQCLRLKHREACDGSNACNEHNTVRICKKLPAKYAEANGNDL